MSWRLLTLAGAFATALVTTALPSAAAEKSAVSLEGIELAKPTAEQAEALNLLPESLQPYYVGYWLLAEIGKNPYAGWTPPEGPWKFCYNDSYQGNSWRQAALDKYKALVADYKEKGLASEDLVVTNSNNDINVQLSQLNNLVREGCNVILSIPSSPTGLCSGIKDAHDKGVLVVTVESPVTCPEAINVGFNEYFVAAKTAKWVADAIGGKGNVFLINGIPGLAPTLARHQAALDVLGNFPDINVVGEVEGQWTPSTVKTNTLKFLATHPQQIDGVVDSGLGAVSAWQAFEQSGRPLPKINGFVGECSYLAYVKEKDIPVYSTSQGGAAAVWTGFDVATRMLNGEKPVVSTLLMPLPEITPENVDDWYTPDMTVQSSCFADPPDGRRVSPEFLDQYFTKG
ncbi:MAG: substrate-binding domain-containing protein [Bauldia sp.]|uniref:substrate-binding domain-containing protein n=1 Tax=Bauldia sp. TaxID=2575872 RepID=UPI001D3856FF|nr:substrate-binding domain-containing protein [Bauldia sp.]MCB1494768.1 substrate-binding domain-containing protein [Bauldia sp.]